VEKIVISFLIGSITAFASVDIGVCISCHGKDFDTRAIGKSDIVSNMSKESIFNALKEYKSGNRNMHGMGALMRGQVASYSDSELEELAIKIASLNNKQHSEKRYKTNKSNASEISGLNISFGVKVGSMYDYFKSGNVPINDDDIEYHKKTIGLDSGVLGFDCITENEIDLKINKTLYKHDNNQLSCKTTGDYEYIITWDKSNQIFKAGENYIINVREVDIASDDVYPEKIITLSSNDIERIKKGEFVKKDIGSNYFVGFSKTKSSIGEFKNGKDTLYFSNGNKRYEGEFKHGKYGGNGILYHENGNKAYVGEFKNGKFDGNGTLYYENGNKTYVGQFKNGKFDGNGTAYYKNGNKGYEGQFKNGKEWNGKFYNSKGEFISDYKNGKEITITEVYQGYLLDDLKLSNKDIDIFIDKNTFMKIGKYGDKFKIIEPKEYNNSFLEKKPELYIPADKREITIKQVIGKYKTKDTISFEIASNIKIKSIDYNDKFDLKIIANKNFNYKTKPIIINKESFSLKLNLEDGTVLKYDCIKNQDCKKQKKGEL